MSTDIQTSQGVVDRREFTVWCHSFQGKNVSWQVDQRLMVGNFFIGLQAWNGAIFNGADIPAGAEILSATATYVTQQTGIGDPIEIRLNTPFRGESYGTIPLTDPRGNRSWRQQFWVAPETLMRNSSDNDIGISPVTPAVPDNAWALWDEDSTAVGLSGPEDTTAMRQRFSSRILVLTPGGGNVLDYIRTILSKNGVLPPGTDAFFDIHAERIGVSGVSLPDDDIILATSDAVSVATIAAQNAYDFNFSGADQITLTPGDTVHAVLRLEPEPPITGFQFVTQHSKSTFGQPSQHLTYGAGVGFDWQNFPGTADVATGITAAGANNLADNVLWFPALNPVVGQLNVTPDITDLVQAQVDHPNYEIGGRLLILTQYTQLQNPQNRVWASFNSLSQNPPVIDVTWRARDGGGGPGHGNIILEPSARIEKVPSMSDDQLALLAVTVIEEFE